MISIRNLIIFLIILSIFVLHFFKYLFIDDIEPDKNYSDLKFTEDEMILFCAIASKGADVAMSQRQASVSKEIALFNMIDSIDRYMILGEKLEGLKLKPQGELNFNEIIPRFWFNSLNTAYERPIELNYNKKEEVIYSFQQEFLYICIGSMMKKIY